MMPSHEAAAVKCKHTTTPVTYGNRFVTHPLRRWECWKRKNSSHATSLLKFSEFPTVNIRLDNATCLRFGSPIPSAQGIPKRHDSIARSRGGRELHILQEQAHRQHDTSTRFYTRIFKTDTWDSWAAWVLVSSVQAVFVASARVDACTHANTWEVSQISERNVYKNKNISNGLDVFN